MKSLLHILICLQIVNLCQSKIFSGKQSDSQLNHIDMNMIGKFWVDGTHPWIAIKYEFIYPKELDFNDIPENVTLFAMKRAKYRNYHGLNNNSSSSSQKQDKLKVPFEEKLKENFEFNNKLRERRCGLLASDSVFKMVLNLKDLKTNIYAEDRKMKVIKNSFDHEYELLHEVGITKDHHKFENHRKTNNDKYNKQAFTKLEKSRHDLIFFIVNCSELKDRTHFSLRQKIKGSESNDRIHSHLSNSKMMLNYSFEVKSHHHACEHDSSHLSYEEFYILEFTILYLIIYTIMSVIYIIEMKKWYNDSISVDMPAQLFSGNIISQAVSLSLRFISILMIKYTGSSYVWLAFLIKLYHFASDATMSVHQILLGIGFGTKWARKISHMQMFIIGCVLLGVKYVVLILQMFLVKPDFAYHDYEGWIGIVECFGSIGIAIWFMVCWSQVGLYNDRKYTKFMGIVAKLGLVFFLAKPLMIFVVGYCVHMGDRSFYIFAWEYGASMICCIVMMITIFSKKGSYMKIAISTGIDLTGDDVKDLQKSYVNV